MTLTRSRPRASPAARSLAALVAVGVSIVAVPVAAQQYPNVLGSPNVTIDLGVLDALGAAPAAGPAPGFRVAPLPRFAPIGPTAPTFASVTTQGVQGLLPPPAVAPRSSFNEQALVLLGPTPVTPQGGPALRRPQAGLPERAPEQAPQAAPRQLVRVPPALPPAAPSPRRADAPAVPPPPRMPVPQVAAPAAPRVAALAPKVTAPPPPSPQVATAPKSPAPDVASLPRVAAPQQAAPQVAAQLQQPAAPAPRIAARPPADEQPNRILFTGGSDKLPEKAKKTLRRIAGELSTGDELRVQLLAYAQGTPETASQARRLSLLRALAVRSYLIERGVRSTRMDVRALGNKVEGGPADRVEVVLVQR